MTAIQKHSPKILHQYLESIKVYNFRKDLDVQLHPKGIFELVFQSKSCFYHNTSYSSGWEIRPSSFIGGLHNRTYNVRSLGNNDYCIAVEFKPNAARHFIPYKLHYFQNALIDISEIWGNPAIELSQRLTSEKLISKKIELIESFLVDQFRVQKISPIDESINAIKAANGFIEANELASKANLSNAHFRKRFKDEIGISPGQYCKIIRMNSSLNLIIKEPQRSLTELTYLLGYFDQSHFIKDFKSITGFSPKCFKQAI
jgi:AraC-like DNA-binding protein